MKRKRRQKPSSIKEISNYHNIILIPIHNPRLYSHSTPVKTGPLCFYGCNFLRLSVTFNISLDYDERGTTASDNTETTDLAVSTKCFVHIVSAN